MQINVAKSIKGEVIQFIKKRETKSAVARGVACRQIAYAGRVVFIKFIKPVAI